jgi:receptor protein-tyrosine kinase
METILNDWSSGFHGMLLFDSPPLLMTNEARVLAGLAGQVVLVVAAGKTLQSSVLEAVSFIPEDCGLNLLLNQVAGAAQEFKYGAVYGRAEPELQT